LTKPIAKLLEVSVSTYVREKSIAADDSALGMLKSIDVVLGGDHGQGKFRSVIKIILGDDDRKQVDSMVMKVGHIDCVKDTYDMLKSSVAGPLNESIEEAVKSGHYNWSENTMETYLAVWKTMMIISHYSQLLLTCPSECLSQVTWLTS
jgi:hypothetical protein